MEIIDEKSLCELSVNPIKLNQIIGFEICGASHDLHMCRSFNEDLRICSSWMICSPKAKVDSPNR